MTKRKLTLFDTVNYTLLIIITLLMLLPLIYVLSSSISDPADVYYARINLLPKNISFEGFKRVFSNDLILTGYKNTIFYTFIGTLISLSFTFGAAFSLSRKELFARKVFMSMFLITMFFSGGLVPLYILMNSIGVYDTMWAVILPTAVGCWNIILVRTYISSAIPNELQEAATVDGANDFVVFFKIVLPLCKPIIATMALFMIVGYWNNYFYAMIFLSTETKYPLQLVLRNILILENFTGMFGGAGGSEESIFRQAQLAESLKYSSIVASTLPILLIYPFLSKYFEKGLMVGSIKG